MLRYRHLFVFVSTTGELQYGEIIQGPTIHLKQAKNASLPNNDTLKALKFYKSVSDTGKLRICVA